MRLAPETAIRSGLLVIGIATLGMGFASGIALWIALRALAGIASAWVLIFVSAWCLERLAAAEMAITGREDAGRAVVLSRNATGVLAALEAVGAWITRDPAVRPVGREHYACFTDPIGRLVLEFFDAFYGGG